MLRPDTSDCISTTSPYNRLKKISLSTFSRMTSLFLVWYLQRRKVLWQHTLSESLPTSPPPISALLSSLPLEYDMRNSISYTASISTWVLSSRSAVIAFEIVWCGGAWMESVYLEPPSPVLMLLVDRKHPTRPL